MYGSAKFRTEHGHITAAHLQTGEKCFIFADTPTGSTRILTDKRLLVTPSYNEHLFPLSYEQWVTVHKGRGIYIRRIRVPIAGDFCSISENFLIVYTNKTSVEMTPTCGMVELYGVAVLPPVVWKRLAGL